MKYEINMEHECDLGCARLTDTIRHIPTCPNYKDSLYYLLDNYNKSLEDGSRVNETLRSELSLLIGYLQYTNQIDQYKEWSRIKRKLEDN
jgi:hypothetical protein